MSENSSFSLTYYSFLFAAIGGAIGSSFYLYSLFKSNKDEDKFKDKSISDSNNITKIHNGELTQERALKLMALLHKKTEKYLREYNPKLEEERRANINNSQEYEKICNEYLDLKNKKFKEFTKELEDRYGHSYEDISKVLEPIGPIDMEEKLIFLSVPEFIDKSVWTRDKIYKAFEFYGNKCLEKMNSVSQMIKENSSDQEQKNYLVYQLMIHKYKVDDELFLQFGLNENQLKFLLFEYNLHKDPNIQTILKNISELEDNFS
jgi:hypothetical protein